MKLKLDKFKILIRIVCTIMVLFSIAWSDWVDLTGEEPVRRELDPGEEPQQPIVAITVFDSTGAVLDEESESIADNYTINIDIPGFFINEEEWEGETYSNLYIPGWTNNGDIGQPAVPAKIITIEIPPDKLPSNITVSSSTELTMDNILVIPAQEEPPLCLCDTCIWEPEFSKDITIYESNQLFPEENILSSPYNWMRNHKYLILSIAPFRVKCLDEQIQIGKNITLEITLEADTSPEVQQRLSMATYSFDKIIAKAIGVNNYLGQTEQSRGPEKYMILMDDQFAGNDKLDEFIEWKTRKGYEVSILLTSQINASGAPIHIEIEAHLRTLDPEEYPAYLLIIGNDKPDEGVNGYPFRLGAGQPVGPTDLYFAQRRTPPFDDPANNNFYLPEIYYGRLPADNPSELNIMLDKLLIMDKNPHSSPDIYNNIVVAGKIEDKNNDGVAEMKFFETADAIASYFESNYDGINYNCERAMINPNGITANGHWYAGSILWSDVNTIDDIIIDFDDAFVTTEEARSRIISNINDQGIAILQCCSHGAQDEWQEIDFSTSDILALTNSTKLPLVFSNACHTGSWHLDDNMTHAWLSHIDGGAYAVFSYSNLGLAHVDPWINHGLYMGLLSQYRQFINDQASPWTKDLPDPDIIVEGTATKLGHIINFGKIYMCQKYSTGGDRNKNKHYSNCASYLAGDPESEIVLHEPIDISYNVNHPAQIEAGKPTIFSFTVDLSGQIDLMRNPLQVCIYSEELDIHEVGSIGSISTLFGLSPQTTGEIQVTITGFRISPFTGLIRVVDEINPCDLSIINTKFNDMHVASAQRNIYAGPNVLVEFPADVTFVAGSKIYLYPGFKAKAESGQLFRAFIDKNLYDPDCD